MPNITNRSLIGIVQKTFNVSPQRAKEIANLTAKKAGFTTSMTAYQDREIDPRKQIKFAKNLGTAVKEVGKKYGVIIKGISKNDKNDYQLRQKIKKAITTATNQPKIQAESKKPKESPTDFLKKIENKPKIEVNPINSHTEAKTSGSALARQPDEITNKTTEKPGIKYEKESLSDNLANFEAIPSHLPNNEPSSPDIG